MYEPAGVNFVVDINKVEVPELPGVRARFVELNDKTSPDAVGETEEVRATVPVKPTLATVTVDVAELLATKVPGLGVLEVIVRSAVTVIDRVAVWVIEPNFAVNVIV